MCFNFLVNWRWICWLPQLQINVSISAPWKIHCLWKARNECFQPPLDISYELCVSSSCITSPSSDHISGKTCQMSTQTSYSVGALLDAGSWPSHSSWHVGRLYLPMSYHKNTHHGFFCRLGAQGSAITAFPPLAAERCVKVQIKRCDVVDKM